MFGNTNDGVKENEGGKGEGAGRGGAEPASPGNALKFRADLALRGGVGGGGHETTVIRLPPTPTPPARKNSVWDGTPSEWTGRAAAALVLTRITHILQGQGRASAPVPAAT